MTSRRMEGQRVHILVADPDGRCVREAIAALAASMPACSYTVAAEGDSLVRMRALDAFLDRPEPATMILVALDNNMAELYRCRCADSGVHARL